MKTKSANGTKGILISTENGYMFRVYDSENIENFTDYSLHHSDLSVTITDEDAYFYDNRVLDHSPKTLGIKE